MDPIVDHWVTIETQGSYSGSYGNHRNQESYSLSQCRDHRNPWILKSIIGKPKKSRDPIVDPNVETKETRDPTVDPSVETIGTRDSIVDPSLETIETRDPIVYPSVETIETRDPEVDLSVETIESQGSYSRSLEHPRKPGIL